MKLELTGPHRATYNTIFHHPVTHNLKWRDVRSMFDAMADVVEQDDGNLKVTRNGQSVVLRPPRDGGGGDATPIEELMKIREFIGRSADAPAPQAPAATDMTDATEATEATDGTHLLVVIDHREARVYETQRQGAVPRRVTPFDPDGSGKHLHRMEGPAKGRRKPGGHGGHGGHGGFYEAVARALRGAEKVLVFGHGTGAGGAMEELLAELKRHHVGLAERVLGSVVVDERLLTEDQLLAGAREFYATLPAPAQR